MEAYGQAGADVTDIGDYVRRFHAPGSAAFPLSIPRGISYGRPFPQSGCRPFVVIALFRRLIVERNRDAISLQKALGFTSGEISPSLYSIRWL